MIIVKLMGGLGNQLFQYAFARHLAIRHSTSLKVDGSGLNTKELAEKGTVRESELSKFSLHPQKAGAEELKHYQKNKFGKIVDHFLLHLGFNKLYIREPHFKFFAKALDAPVDSYLDGYWQSERYFSAVRKELLEELIPAGLSQRTEELAVTIKSVRSVSIHVRRGDYVSSPENQKLYAVCDAEYYCNAMAKMVSLQGDCEFFVFSDEPEWFRKNVSSESKFRFVEHNTGSDSYQDLYLMSVCKHNIIANSSFSWWGAWLNNNPEKTVIAPQLWFKNDAKDTTDLIPSTWIRL